MDARIANAPYTGVWTADLDSEGDLDLLLSSPEAGTVALRNTGDSRFEPLDLFSEVSGLVDFAWADFDGDGDPDPALLSNSGELFLYANERLGRFMRRTVPPIFGNILDITVGDVNSDSRMDVVALAEEGGVYLVSDTPEGGWVVSELFVWNQFPNPSDTHAELFVGDFDINGSIDVLVSRGGASLVNLSEEPGVFNESLPPIEGNVLSVAMMQSGEGGDGLLDLIGIDSDGVLSQWASAGTKPYHWQVIRPRAGQALGDQRINSFTIGGER